MDIKIAKLERESDAIMLGLEALPERLSQHTRKIVNRWAFLVDPFQAISAFELADRIRHIGKDTDDRVDAELLEELAAEARDILSNQSRVLYRLDGAMIP